MDNCWIGTLDISKCQNLKELELSCKIDNLEYQDNCNLEYIALRTNLKHLDLRKQKKLTYFKNYADFVTTISFPKGNKIKSLELWNNDFGQIDWKEFSQLKKLTLGCTNSEFQYFPKFDLTYLEHLENLTVYWSGAILKKIDVSNNLKLEEISLPDDKEILISCNELQAFLIPKFATKLSLKPNEKQKTIIESLKLHDRAANYNWDWGIDGLHGILNDENCDLGTAYLIYWLSAPNYYLNYETADEIKYDSDKNKFNFIINLERDILSGKFRNNIIPFNPRSYYNTDWTEYSHTKEPTKRTIPVQLKDKWNGNLREYFDVHKKYEFIY